MHETAIIKITVFKGRGIRKTLYKNEWWFSVIDIVEALTDSVNPRDYWFRMKDRVRDEDGFEPSTVCRQLKLEASDGKMRETDCADTEGIFRIIQSIPSPKAEPLKRWLAKVGYERVQEIENPELATKRTRMLYRRRSKITVRCKAWRKNRRYCKKRVGERVRSIHCFKEELFTKEKTRKLLSK